MLNDSTVARTAPYTAPPQTLSHQPTRQQTYPPYPATIPSYLVHQAPHRERPSQPPPLQPPELCSPTIGFDPAPSPSQHTLPSTSSIHSGRAHSGVGFSPGRNQLAKTRDGAPHINQQNISFIPSTSSHSSHYPNQGPVQQYQQQIQRSLSGLPEGASLSSAAIPRESHASLNGPPHSSSHQFSPHFSHPSLPGTPLGPPAPFQKLSPRATQRAASYGLEHMRTQSGGSLGSQFAHDYSDRSTSYHHTTPSRESSVRQYSYDREREKSTSVSPKTIPRPSPFRQVSMESSQQPHVRRPSPKPSISPKAEQMRLISSIEGRLDVASTSSPTASKYLDHVSSPHQSPGHPTQHSTPSSNNAMPPTRSSPTVHRQPALKRNASAISGSSSSPQPPRKRSRRTEIPIFARSARPNKPPLKFIMKDNIRPISNVPLTVNGHATVNGDGNHAQPAQTIPVLAVAPIEPSDWEPSIMGSTPYEEMTRYVCDKIYNTIGNADPPTNGAVFEIEAKLGEIHSTEEGRRLRLPVMTETIFDKANFGSPTRFESSMNVVSISLASKQICL